MQKKYSQEVIVTVKVWLWTADTDEQKKWPFH